VARPNEPFRIGHAGTLACVAGMGSVRQLLSVGAGVGAWALRRGSQLRPTSWSLQAPAHWLFELPICRNVGGEVPAKLAKV
jgi:hypothetical protein